MNSYTKYKEWWFENHGPSDLNEKAFQEHINSLSAYQLLEALQMFKDEGTYPQEGWGDWQKRTTPAQPRKQTCSKCVWPLKT
jgi:hypothetical protein